ncbi:hypothetical protein [Sulfurimonas sp.]|uniref:hypothetical protein n=1 Tax=Sulfurimonas sp. TaxID=2022749 RepID=UPI0035642961
MFKIKNTLNGIQANLSGFKTEDISSKIEACKDGACECSCDIEIMKKIEKIEVSKTEDGTSVTITGDVNAETLAPMMQECLMYNK